MTTEPSRPVRTPSAARLVDQYARSRAEKEVDDYETAKADTERGIAKIKANALREAAEREFPLSSHISFTGIAIRERLQFRADRIEAEA